MASMIVGGLFNAVAFAGAGYLFSTFNKKDYQKEAKRHDLAMEKLSKSKEEFYEKERARKDREAKLKAELYDAKSDMKDTNKAFSELKKILQQREIPPPRLEDFYQPSDEMKKYQIITMGLMGGGGGWLLHKLI